MGELLEKINQRQDDAVVFDYIDYSDIIKEAQRDMEKHALTLNIESAFVNPPAIVETLKAIPLSIWKKWFGEEAKQ